MYKRVTPRDLTEALNYNGTFEDMDRFYKYAHALWELENDMEAMWTQYDVIKRDTAQRIVGMLKAYDTENELGLIIGVIEGRFGLKEDK